MVGTDEALVRTVGAEPGSDTTIDIHDRLNAGFGTDIDGEPVDTSDVERRKFHRYTVHIPGFAVCGDQHPTRCVVWDFSAQGLRVTRVLKSALDEQVEVPGCRVDQEMRLVLRVPGTVEPLSLTGYVRRCRQADGLEYLGLRTPTLSETAFRTLLQHADQVQSNLCSARSRFGYLQGWPMLAEYVDGLFTEGFRRAYERLLLLTDWKDEWDDRAQTFYAMVELRPLEERLLRLLVRELLDSMGVPEPLRRKALSNVSAKGLWDGSAAGLIEVVGQFLGAGDDPDLSLLEPESFAAIFEHACARADVPAVAEPVIKEAMLETAQLYWAMLDQPH